MLLGINNDLSIIKFFKLYAIVIRCPLTIFPSEDLPTGFQRR